MGGAGNKCPDLQFYFLGLVLVCRSLERTDTLLFLSLAFVCHILLSPLFIKKSLLNSYYKLGARISIMLKVCLLPLQPYRIHNNKRKRGLNNNYKTL